MGTRAHLIVVGGPPSLASLLRARIEELDRKWSRFRPDSKMHDPMAASAALGLPIVRFEQDGLLINEHGQTIRDPQARPALLSISADHDALMAWLRPSLGLAPAEFTVAGEHR